MGIKSGHLLVVDDNKDKRNISRLLKLQGYPAVGAVNGSRVFLGK